jgi:hypothetical protein
MILNSYYKDDLGNRVYLEAIDATNAFYKVGRELVVSSLKFFESKYKLGF